jgi:hypothetical protein
MSYQRPVIGNQGQEVQTRNYVGGNPYAGYPGLGGSQLPTSYTGGVESSGGLGGLGGLLGGGAGGSGFNMAQLKQFVDKMGGIEGLMAKMQQAQKMIATFQQFAPMAKLLLGSFGAAKAKSSEGDHDLDGLAPVKRRRRRKRRGTAKGRRRRR